MNTPSATTDDSDGDPTLLTLPAGCRLLAWKVGNGSVVRAGETVALAVPIDAAATSFASAAARAEPAQQQQQQQHKRPSRRRRPAPQAVAAAQSPSHWEEQKPPNGGAPPLLDADDAGDRKPAAAATESSSSSSTTTATKPANHSGSSSNSKKQEPTTISIKAKANGFVRIEENAAILGHIEKCQHPEVLEGLCTVCGAELEPKTLVEAGSSCAAQQGPPNNNDNSNDSTFANGTMDAADNAPSNSSNGNRRMTVAGCTVTVTAAESERMAAHDAARLHAQCRLSLVLDLDHTLLHATADPRAAAHERDRGDVRSLVLPVPRGPPANNNNNRQQPQPGVWYQHHHVKLRPFVREFFDAVQDRYEVGVYTAGTREYAEQVCLLLARHHVRAPCDAVGLDRLRHRAAAGLQHKRRASQQQQRKEQQQQQQQQQQLGEASDGTGQSNKVDPRDFLLFNDAHCRVVTGGCVCGRPGDQCDRLGHRSLPDSEAPRAPPGYYAWKRAGGDGTSSGRFVDGDFHRYMTVAQYVEWEKKNDSNNSKDDKEGKEKKEPPQAVAPPPASSNTTPKKRKRVSFGEKPEEKTDEISQRELDELRAELEEAERLEKEAVELRQKLFGSRVCSRTDVGDLGTNVKSLKRIFPCGGSMAAVVDDREDVWANDPDLQSARRGEPPENLLLVRPYHWSSFAGFADVNNAAGADLAATDAATATPESENDDQLLATADILKRLHQRYYNANGTPSNNNPGALSVPKILEQMRSEVLSGCEVVLSGLVPLHKQQQHQQQQEQQQQRLPRPTFVRYAENLGARVENSVSKSTTHVVAAKDGTDKILAARRIRGCRVVKAAWLVDCARTLKRCDEDRYLLLGPPGAVAAAAPAAAATASMQPLVDSTRGNSSGSSSGEDDDDDDFAANLENEMMAQEEGSS